MIQWKCGRLCHILWITTCDIVLSCLINTCFFFFFIYSFFYENISVKILWHWLLCSDVNYNILPTNATVNMRTSTLNKIYCTMCSHQSESDQKNLASTQGKVLGSASSQIRCTGWSVSKLGIKDWRQIFQWNNSYRCIKATYHLPADPLANHLVHPWQPRLLLVIYHIPVAAQQIKRDERDIIPLLSFDHSKSSRINIP